MSYVVIKDRIIDSEEIQKKIQETFYFKKVKDLTRGSKREDTLIYQVIHDAIKLKQEISLEGFSGELDQEELADELMNLADEHTSYIEYIIPEDCISHVYSYRYDEDLEEVKTIFLAVDDTVGELRLMDILDRILRSVD